MSDPTQVPPHNFDAERAVLGSILIDPDAIHAAAAIIEARDFYSTPHQHIYASMIRLWQAEKPIDTMILYNELKHSTQLEEIGGLTYLMTLEGAVATTANVEHHANIVAEKSRLRSALAAGLMLIDQIHREDWTDNADEVLVRHEQAITDIQQGDSKKNKGAFYALDDFFDRADKYPELESLWANGAVKTGTINILSAQTGLGKSILTTQLGLCVACGLKFLGLQTAHGRVLMVQTEIADRELIHRIQDRMIGQFTTGLDEKQQDAAMTNFVVRDHAEEFHLYATPPRNGSIGQNPATRYVRELVRAIDKWKPALVILDPLSDILRFCEIDGADIAAGFAILKRMASIHGVAFLLAHHVNKAAYGVKAGGQTSRGHTKIIDTASAHLDLSYLKGKKRAKLAFSKLRYRAPSAPLILKLPTAECLFFETDSEPIESDKPKPGCQEILDVLAGADPLFHDELKKHLAETYDVDPRTAKRWISDARDAGTVGYDTATLKYFTPDEGTNA